MSTIGILAYGSLIQDPGVEIQPLVTERIPTQTPFPVEYARLSGIRGGAPTVVPHSSGKPVRAEILVLHPSVSLPQAQALLWRRETRRMGTGKPYPAGNSPNSVLVSDLPGFHGLDHVLYTDFPAAGKLDRPTANELATAAVASVGKAPLDMDGISYLMQLSESGVETALTAEYRAKILCLTSAGSLAEARNHLRDYHRKGG